MATVTGLTAERMQEIIDATIVDADVVGDNLILTKDDGGTIDCGSVRGATGPTGATGVAGPEGPPGSVNAIYSDIWSWTTSLTAASSSGQVGLNAATWAAATQINMNEATKDGRNVSVLAFPRINIGDQLYLQHKTDPTRYAYFTVSGAPVDNGTWWSFPVTFDRGTGAVPGGTTDTNVSLMKAGAGSLPVQDEGTLLTARSKLNFIGAVVAATDDAANDRTNVTIDVSALSAAALDKIAWEYPAGTDIVELYGSRIAAGIALAQQDQLNSDTRANYTAFGDGQPNFASTQWQTGGMGAGYYLMAAPVAWGNADDSARLRARGAFGSSGTFGVGFVKPGSVTQASLITIELAPGAVKLAYNGPWNIGGGTQFGSISVPSLTAGTFYVLEATRSGNDIIVVVKDSTDTTTILAATTVNIPSGAPRTAYGAGVALRPSVVMNQLGGTGDQVDWWEYWTVVAEQRDLFLAITPSSGSRVVKRLYGSLGGAFRSDFVQPTDLLPYSLSGTDYAANAQSANYTLVLTDAGKTVEMNLGSDLTVTVPPNSSVAFPIGTIVEVSRYGSGGVTMAAGSGVTIRSRGGLLTIGNRYGAVSLRKRAADEWVLVGDLA